MWIAGVEGFVLGGSLIIAIGAQNAFILRQGLLKQYVFILCLVASMSDAVLILAGILGFGSLVRSSENLLFAVTIGGAIFLLSYALIAARRAMIVEKKSMNGQDAQSLGSALSILLAFTFLNPHVYLDTVLLIGGISGQYSGVSRNAFAVGAMASSFVWFFALGYGARWLAPLFQKSMAWRVLDGIIALIMTILGASLLFRAFS